MKHPCCLSGGWGGQRLNGAPVLEPFLEQRQVLVHPAAVQPDGFQSFLHAPHLRAALLQTREETLHLDDTQWQPDQTSHRAAGGLCPVAKTATAASHSYASTRQSSFNVYACLSIVNVLGLWDINNNNNPLRLSIIRADGPVVDYNASNSKTHQIIVIYNLIPSSVPKWCCWI